MKSLSSKYIGMVTGAVMVICALLLFYIVKLPAIGESQYIIWGIYTTGIIWCLLSYKNRTGGGAFKEYFSEGFKTFIVAVLMMAVYIFVFYKMNPQIMEKMIGDNNALIVKDGNHIGPELRENADKFRSIFIPGMLMSNITLYLVLGALISATGAGFLSQKKA